jgi:branched-chain amino acid transport system ATP-binding protein
VHFGGLAALSDVSLEVREGQIIAVIGPNGAGKTTLFNVISRLQKVGRGGLWFAEDDIANRATAEVARLGIARTFRTASIRT